MWPSRMFIIVEIHPNIRLGMKKDWKEFKKWPRTNKKKYEKKKRKKDKIFSGAN